MTLSRSTILRKVNMLTARRTEDEQRSIQDAWLLIDIIHRNNPTPADLRKFSALGETRYRAAFKRIKDKVWLVGGRYEMRTETAEL